MSKRIAILISSLLLVTSLVSAEQVTLRFFHRWPQEPRKSYYDALVAEFERQNPDIKIVMDSVVNDSYKEKSGFLSLLMISLMCSAAGPTRLRIIL